MIITNPLFAAAGATELAFNFCKAMMKTWQELAHTNENKLKRWFSKYVKSLKCNSNNNFE